MKGSNGVKFREDGGESFDDIMFQFIEGVYDYGGSFGSSVALRRKEIQHYIVWIRCSNKAWKVSYADVFHARNPVDDGIQIPVCHIGFICPMRKKLLGVKLGFQSFYYANIRDLLKMNA